MDEYVKSALRGRAYRREDTETRFLRLVEKTPACWTWLGTRSHRGYGRFHLNDRQRSHSAHRVAYELWIGPVPEGLEIDHLCRNRGCVNPAHLEAVTRRENQYRGKTLSAANLAKTHCPQGHPYDEENTRWSRGKRVCKTCAREGERKRRASGATAARRRARYRELLDAGLSPSEARRRV